MGKGKHLYNTLRSALSDPEFMPSGGILGVPCFHLYERASDVPSFRGPVKEDIKGSDLRMKGADAFVYLAAAHLGLAPKIFTIMTDASFEEQVAIYPAWPSFEDALALTSPTVIEDSFLARGLDLQNLRSERWSLEIGGKEISHQDMFEAIDWLIDFPTLRGSGSSNLFPARPIPIIECFTSGTGYFGNEAGDSTVYASAAIAIPVPAYEVRCKNPKLQLQQQQQRLSSSSAAASATSESASADSATSSGVGVGVSEDFEFFKGTKVPGALPREEFARAQSRFKAFMHANNAFSLAELREAAEGLCKCFFLCTSSTLNRILNITSSLYTVYWLYMYMCVHMFTRVLRACMSSPTAHDSHIQIYFNLPCSTSVYRPSIHWFREAACESHQSSDAETVRRRPPWRLHHHVMRCYARYRCTTITRLSRSSAERRAVEFITQQVLCSR
jgi:hypothetical protein